MNFRIPWDRKYQLSLITPQMDYWNISSGFQQSNLFGSVDHLTKYWLETWTFEFEAQSRCTTMLQKKLVQRSGLIKKFSNCIPNIVIYHHLNNVKSICCLKFFKVFFYSEEESFFEEPHTKACALGRYSC